jgi:uncharacterized protein with FMN-binding domain
LYWVCFFSFVIFKNIGWEDEEDEHVQVGLKNKIQVSSPTPIPQVTEGTSGQVITNSTPTATPVPAVANSSGYRDGSYTGNSEDAFYGKIQVKAVISGGRIIDVIFLDFPQDNGTSRSINSQADPMLTAEAISAQSANVDIISGASYSSMAFQKSLASALSQAK